jgi:hypothetical protein
MKPSVLIIETRAYFAILPYQIESGNDLKT